MKLFFLILLFAKPQTRGKRKCFNVFFKKTAMSVFCLKDVLSIGRINLREIAVNCTSKDKNKC